MINSKLEKVLAILLFVIILFIYEFAIAPTDLFNSEIDRFISLVFSFICAYGIRCFYTYKMTQNASKKIQGFYDENKFAEALEYINDCINKNPKAEWLHCQKLIAMAYNGDFSGYKSYSSQLKISDNKTKELYQNIISMLDQLILYLEKGILPTYSGTPTQNDKPLFQLIYLLSRPESLDSSEIISSALHICNSSNANIIKATAAFVIYKEYRKMNADDLCDMYAETIREYAPSKEFLNCWMTPLSSPSISRTVTK